MTPLGGARWEGGGDSYIHKGSYGRWRDILTAGDVAAHSTRGSPNLGAAWLANGSFAARRAAA